jgi:2',3'-cyclic-nucleotide 2'-phosphodiesterase (5'-nucleotidase family)
MATLSLTKLACARASQPSDPLWCEGKHLDWMKTCSTGQINPLCIHRAVTALSRLCSRFKTNVDPLNQESYAMTHPTRPNILTKLSCKSIVGLCVASACLALLTACGGSDDAPAVAPPAAPAAASFTMQLLHLADADGSDSNALGSIANLSGLVSRFRAEMPETTLLVSSGDNYIPGPRFNASGDRATLDSLLGRADVGRADMEFLNALGVQASALGNHELDLGPLQFNNIINKTGDGSTAWSGARFPYLAYNVDFAPESSVSGLATANGALANTLANRVSGWARVVYGTETIGIIGASSPSFTTIATTGALGFTPAPTGGGNFDVSALAANLQLGINEMRAAGINKIVLLAHMQTLSVERQLAGLLDGVDIIVAGGSNTLLSDANDVLRTGDVSQGTYPIQLTSRTGEPVAVVNVDADYKYLGRFIAPFDSQGRLIPALFDTARSGAQITSQTNDTAGGVIPIARVVQVRDALNGVIAAQDGNVQGSTSVFLDGRRSAVRNQETNFGNLTADANLFYAQQIDPSVRVSLKNGGGIRSEIGEVIAPAGSTDPTLVSFAPPRANPAANRAAGEISQLAIASALRFNNSLATLDVTAARLKELLEHGVAVLGSQGRFPQVGGMAFSYDPAGTAQVVTAGVVSTPGTRIRSLRIGSEDLVRNGVLVGDPNRTIRMVTLGFLAGGGDGYPFGPVASQSNRVDLNTVATDTTGGGRSNFALPGTEQDALSEFLQSRFKTTPFALAETPDNLDTRIQNISRRTDTVLP